MASIELALEYLHSLDSKEKVDIKETAEKFGVDDSTLRRAFRQATGSKEKHNNQRLLNKQQSDILIKRINDLTERGLPPTNQMIANLAKEISGKEPGKTWAQRWVKAHSDKVISRRYSSEGLDTDGKRVDHPALKYSLYFELLRRKIEQYNLSPDQIYNMDEKGFMIGIMATAGKRIFSRQQYEQGTMKQRLQDENREWITTIACICANGTALSPGLIYKAKSENRRDPSWFQDFDPKEHAYFFASSESGWTDNELGFQWLKDVFDKETKAQANGGWRLLILGGYASHINMKFIEYCDQNRILLAMFPAHATRTLQPLDVGLFGSLSGAYSENLVSLIYESPQGLSWFIKRDDFFRLFGASWATTFTRKNIHSAFKRTGLNPFDPEVILQRYNKKKSESRPTSSTSRSTASALRDEDWRKIRKMLQEIVQDIHNDYERNTLAALSAENILLESCLESLERAHINEKKKRRAKKKKPSLPELPLDSDGNTAFWSPAQEQARKSEKQKKGFHEPKFKRKKQEQQRLQAIEKH